jgi:NTE family protein
MNNRKKKIGLALGGGAARGLAHVGVVRVLHNAGIPIDMIAGTSAGAIIGAAYASHLDPDRLLSDALDANWKKMRPLIDPSLPRSGFIKGGKVRELIATYVGGDVDFKDLMLPFACVATDIDTGEEIVIDNGSLLEALRATISIPGIFRAVKLAGRYVVDGGLTTPVPVELVRKMGADFIIAVNVNPDVTGRLGKASRRRIEKKKEPNLFQVMMQSLYISTDALAQHNLAGADFVIKPEMSPFSAGDFNKVPEIIESGRQAAEAALPLLKRLLGM